MSTSGIASLGTLPKQHFLRARELLLLTLFTCPNCFLIDFSIEIYLSMCQAILFKTGLSLAWGCKLLGDYGIRCFVSLFSLTLTKKIKLQVKLP